MPRRAAAQALSPCAASPAHPPSRAKAGCRVGLPAQRLVLLPLLRVLSSSAPPKASALARPVAWISSRQASNMERQGSVLEESSCRALASLPGACGIRACQERIRSGQGDWSCVAPAAAPEAPRTPQQAAHPATQMPAPPQGSPAAQRQSQPAIRSAPAPSRSIAPPRTTQSVPVAPRAVAPAPRSSAPVSGAKRSSASPTRRATGWAASCPSASSTSRPRCWSTS